MVLTDYFPRTVPVAFSDGNIMLGGGGSDFIEGRGGNDIIDGDARLHVELTSRAAGGQIIREVLYDQAVGPTFRRQLRCLDGEPVEVVVTAGDVDTAVFADVLHQLSDTFATDPKQAHFIFGTDGNVALVVTVSAAVPAVGAVAVVGAAGASVFSMTASIPSTISSAYSSPTSHSRTGFFTGALSPTGALGRPDHQ